MKESYREGVANHSGPEPCEAAVTSHLKRWTGVSVGWVLSSEISQSGPGSRRRQTVRKATTRHCDIASKMRPRGVEMRYQVLAPKTPGMQRNSMRENRETPSPPAGREERAMSH